MAKFKIGDRVVLNGDFTKNKWDEHPMSAKKGATGTVTPYHPRVFKDTVLVGIKWDRDDLSGGQCDGGYQEDRFDLIPAGTAKVRSHSETVTVEVPDKFVWVDDGEFAYLVSEEAYEKFGMAFHREFDAVLAIHTRTKQVIGSRFF